MKVKIYYTKVIEQEIDINDKFSKLNPNDADMLAELYDIGWDTVVDKHGYELVTIETLNGEVLLEL